MSRGPGRGGDVGELARIEPGPPPRPLARRQRLERAAGALLFAGLLGVAAFLPAARPLPFDACVLHHFAGIPCLGCGLTRSIVRLLQGDLLASLRLHPAGPLIAGILAGQSVRQGIEAFLARECGGTAIDRITSGALVTALLIALVFRLAGFLGA
ncbi:MAG TPA: DUF2752 domain-containing protein [Patescibacteria group bacterium]|nr:DUF2752 domain-containing protein [Patescibacteria group bacterium]